MAILSKLVIAITGSLPHESSQIKRWVELNGGKWSTGVKKGVTHLIASKDAYQKPTDVVQQAHAKGTCIVSYDWLEDSLQRGRKLSEKNYKWEFLMKQRRKQKELKRLGAMADRKKFRDGCEKARELTGSGTSNAALTRKPRKSTSFFFKAESTPYTPPASATKALECEWAEREVAPVADIQVPLGQAQNPIEIEDEIPIRVLSSLSPSTSPQTTSAKATPKEAKPLSSFSNSTAPPSATITESEAKTPHFKDLYHYYLDSTGFEYKIVLARSDFSINSYARYHIGLLESHIKPQTYCTVVQYTPPAKKTPELKGGVSAISESGLRNQLLRFLNDKKTVAPQRAENKNDDGTRQVWTQAAGISPVQNSKTPAQLSITSAKQKGGHEGEDAPEAETTRLGLLITPPAASPELPYKALICPMNSSFTSAWRAFRHAFRDLTHLSWEERFDSNSTIQKFRAQQLGIEPYVYSKPAKGLPMGLLPQEAGLFQGTMNGLEINEDTEEGYIRNSFNLPSISHPLSKHGSIGSSIHREEIERKRKEEEKRVKAEEAEERERRKRGEVKVKKPNYNKPMFNGVTGRPRTDVYGQYKQSVPMTGTGYSGMIRRSRPWPSERYS